MIFETRVAKKFVNTHEEEGFDIEISEMVENQSLPKTKNVSKWMDDKIFPKSNSQETRTAKWVAIYGIVASAIFSFGGVIIGVGMSFILFGFSMQLDPSTINNTNQTNPILFDFADRTIELGTKFLIWGPTVIFLGAIIITFAIIRER